MIFTVTWTALRDALVLGVGAGLLYILWRVWEWTAIDSQGSTKQ